MQRAIDLSDRHAAILQSIFAPYHGAFKEVRLYGSRAQGCASRGSDIDLAIMGLSDERLLARLQTALDESDLPLFAGLIVYENIDSASFKQQIDETSLPLIAGSYKG